MTVDPAGLLDPLAAPSLPAEFSAAIRGVMKGPDVGSCGTAAYMRQPVFVTDIANDPQWATFKDLALAADLRACLSAEIRYQKSLVYGTGVSVRLYICCRNIIKKT